MTHLEFLTLFGNFIIGGQASGFKPPKTTNMRTDITNFRKLQHKILKRQYE